MRAYWADRVCLGHGPWVREFLCVEIDHEAGSQFLLDHGDHQSTIVLSSAGDLAARRAALLRQCRKHIKRRLSGSLDCHALACRSPSTFHPAHPGGGFHAREK